jgi:hypothetical protein
MKSVLIWAALAATIPVASASAAGFPGPKAGLSKGAVAAEIPGAELIQYYAPPYPPPPYSQQQEYWRERRAEERHQYWEARRRARWRCEHGDYGACQWLSQQPH